MTLRQPHEDAVLPAADVVRIRQALAACSAVPGPAGQHGSLQLETIVARAADLAGLPGGPGVLAYQVNLAIDSLDFATAAGSTR